ncbi:MAG: ribosomal L7Ae/L30e/S12e/Gadd45 family protein [Longimicrobiales bacterium]|nr:ribosomal L7Ae/L30e/S12e/Gadd45 family protein [Longimicrobiales bacterium]
MTTTNPAIEAYALLGLARRAGSVVTGTGAVRDAVRDGRARLVVLARDAAEGQRGKVDGLLRHRTTPHLVWGTQEELGQAVGSAPLSAIAIMEDGIAAQLQAKLVMGEGSAVESDSDEDG